MSLPTSVLAALMAAGTSNEAILAACEAYDLEEQARKDRKRIKDAEHQRARRSRQRSSTKQTDLFERAADDEHRYAEAAIAMEITQQSQSSQSSQSDKEIPPIPPKENTSSLCSEVEENVMEMRTRDPGKLVSTEAHDLAETIGREAGFEPSATPPGWCGAANHIQAFLTQGYFLEDIHTAVTTTLRRLAARGRDPPDDFSYFRKPIASICAELRAPLPKVAERHLEVIHGGKHAGARNGAFAAGIPRSRNHGSATDAAHDLAEYFARKAEEEERAGVVLDCKAGRADDGGVSL